MKKKETRKIDLNGRITIPWHEELEWGENQKVEMILVRKRIHIKKYEHGSTYVGLLANIDKEHRIFIPKPYMRTCALKEGEMVNLYLWGDRVEISPRND